MIRPYLPGDLWLILPNIREAEVIELQAMGEDLEPTIRRGIEGGVTVTLELGGKVCGVAGIIDGAYWTPWSVFTNDICAHPIEFLRDCKRWLSGYGGPMMNVIDARNKQAIRWLEWLGFEILEPQPMGLKGELFHVYRKGF